MKPLIFLEETSTLYSVIERRIKNQEENNYFLVLEIPCIFGASGAENIYYMYYYIGNKY